MKESYVIRAADGTTLGCVIDRASDDWAVYVFGAESNVVHHFPTGEEASVYAQSLADRYTAERIRYLEGLLHSVDTPCGEQDAIADAIAALKGGC